MYSANYRLERVDTERQETHLAGDYHKVKKKKKKAPMRKERDLKAYCKTPFVLIFVGIGIMLLQIEAGEKLN